jgi:CubicO group peptidase (beta-lactamase class C family)
MHRDITLQSPQKYASGHDVFSAYRARLHQLLSAQLSAHAINVGGASVRFHASETQTPVPSYRPDSTAPHPELIRRTLMTLLPLLAIVPALLQVVSGARSDSLDRTIRREMQKRDIPGLSIAVVDSGRIVLARGYGVTKRGGNAPVTTTTLFQAGSISKAVTAVGAMQLVDRGVLSLDSDVNAQLTSWKVPDTTVAEHEPVTVRRILSHSAGLNVHGFPGYALTDPFPTVVQVLNGAAPANTQAIRVVQRPGTRWEYSGGGYTILQLLMTDVLHEPFDAYMQRAVLARAGMSASTFSQPLPASYVPRAATGHTSDGAPVPGGYHAYPEMAAAGLWTTPSDLARFAMALQHAYRRDSGAFLSAARADQMLSYERNDFMGLGVFLRGNNRRIEFSHGGRDEGFDANLSATGLTGQAVVIMINANDNSAAVERIQRTVARLYHWPDYRVEPVAPVVRAGDARTLAAVAGRYEVGNNRMIMIAPRDGVLYSYADGHEDEGFVQVAQDRFRRVDGDATLALTRDAQRRVTDVTLTDADGAHRAPRVGPLATSFHETSDPAPQRTAIIDTVLRALGDGRGVAVQASLAAGAFRDFSGHVVPDLVGIRSVRYVGEEEISARGISRHDGAVARIVYVSAILGGRPVFVLVHLTGTGAITDYDVVDR